MITGGHGSPTVQLIDTPCFWGTPDKREIAVRKTATISGRRGPVTLTLPYTRQPVRSMAGEPFQDCASSVRIAHLPPPFEYGVTAVGVRPQIPLVIEFSEAGTRLTSSAFGRNAEVYNWHMRVEVLPQYQSDRLSESQPIQ